LRQRFGPLCFVALAIGDTCSLRSARLRGILASSMPEPRKVPALIFLRERRPSSGVVKAGDVRSGLRRGAKTCNELRKSLGTGCRAVKLIQEQSQMAANVGFMKLASIFRRLELPGCDPTRGTIRTEQEPELFICSVQSAMFDVAAGEAATADEAIARYPRPTY